LDITKICPFVLTFCYTLEILKRIKHLFTDKCTAMQSISVAIMTPELHFTTHLLDTEMAYSHKNYIVVNQHGVMYSRLLEKDRLLDPSKVELAKKLVWIKNTETPQHPVIRFESNQAESNYLHVFRMHHKKVYERSKFYTAAGVFIV
jgi:hypothetical protein